MLNDPDVIFWISICLLGLAGITAFKWRKSFNFSGLSFPTLNNPFAGRRLVIRWYWLGVILTALVAIVVALVFGPAIMARWRKAPAPATTSSSPPGNTLGDDAGLPNIDTPAATPWWDSTKDFASNVPDWWAQALFATLAALVVVLLLVAIFKGPRAAFSGWGFIWALLLLIVLSATLFFAIPYVIHMAKEAPDWAVRTWGWGAPVAGKVVLSVAVIAVVLACLIGIRTLSTWGERFATLGAVLLVGYICWFAIWNYDGSQQEYVSAPSGNTSSIDTRSRCPGNGESRTIGPDEWIQVNPGFRCHIIYEVVGAEVLLGEPDNYLKAAPGEKVGNVLRSRGIRVTSFKTTGGYGRLNYMLHPHGCKEQGWDCL